jgi:hypothetical protein
MKTFVTIFSGAENVHLTKDVGMIPYIMDKDYGYDTSIVCFKNGEYPNLQPGMKLSFLHGFAKNKIQRIRIVLNYLLKNSKRIDVLNLFHVTLLTVFCSLVYKIINRKGCLYIKMDCSRKFEINKRFKPYFIFVTFFADIISYECLGGNKILEYICPSVKNKLIYIPNGFD